MAGFLVRRLLSAIPVLVMVAVIVFAILRLTPGDPAAIVAGDSATPEQIEKIRTSMGLDKPIVEQFVSWSAGILHGDFGVSLISGKAVTELIGNRFGPTVALCIFTIIVSVLLSIPMGILAAWKQGSLIDRSVMAVSVAGFSIPVFITEYILILLFASWLGVFPVQGYQPISAGWGPFLQRIVLPVLGLSTIYIALIARIVRTSIIEVMGEDYIRTARAKGLTERAVLLRHALGNAAVPIVTIIGVSIGLLLGGVVVTESVFNIPGLGRLVVEAVLARDYPVIQALILLSSFVYVAINLLTDIIYMVLDPRISY